MRRNGLFGRRGTAGGSSNDDTASDSNDDNEVQMALQSFKANRGGSGLGGAGYLWGAAAAYASESAAESASESHSEASEAVGIAKKKTPKKSSSKRGSRRNDGSGSLGGMSGGMGGAYGSPYGGTMGGLGGGVGMAGGASLWAAKGGNPWGDDGDEAPQQKKKTPKKKKSDRGSGPDDDSKSNAESVSRDDENEATMKKEASDAIRKTSDKVEEAMVDARKRMQKTGENALILYDDRTASKRKGDAIETEEIQDCLDEMRRFHKLRLQFKHMRTIIVDLGQLEIIIKINEAKPDSYKKKIKKIVESPCPRGQDFTDQQLVDHLRSGKFEKQIEA